MGKVQCLKGHWMQRGLPAKDGQGVLQIAAGTMGTYQVMAGMIVVQWDTTPATRVAYVSNDCGEIIALIHPDNEQDTPPRYVSYSSPLWGPFKTKEPKQTLIFPGDEETLSRITETLSARMQAHIERLILYGEDKEQDDGSE